MSMKILYFIVLLLLLNSCGSAQKIQKSIKKEMENLPAINFPNDSTLLSIRESHDLVVGYSAFNQSFIHVPTVYYLIGFTNCQAVAYRYITFRVTANAGISRRIDTLTIDDRHKEAVLAAFNSNRSWLIENHNESLEEYCDDSAGVVSCMIHDASSKALVIMTKSKFKSVSFYAPEFFEKCCPGNQMRKRFLESIKPVYSFFEYR